MLSNSIALVPETCFGSLHFLDGHYCTRVRDILETVEAISRRFSRVDLIDSMGLQTIYCHWRISVWAVKETDKLHSTSHKFILVTWQQELQSVIKQPCHSSTTVVTRAPRNAQEKARQLCSWLCWGAYHCVYDILGSCHSIVLMPFSHNQCVSLYHLTTHPN